MGEMVVLGIMNMLLGILAQPFEMVLLFLFLMNV